MLFPPELDTDYHLIINGCFRPSTVGRNMQKNFRKADTESR